MLTPRDLRWVVLHDALRLVNQCQHLWGGLDLNPILMYPYISKLVVVPYQ